MKKLLSIILVLLLAAALTAGYALAEDGELVVHGTGVVHLNADRAQILLGVRKTMRDVLEAQNAVNEDIDGVINALIESGIEENNIWTNAIGIYPNYDYGEDDASIVSYTAYNTITVVTSDVENIGSYIDAAFLSGANTLDDVSFFASDTAEASKRALQLAVEDAHAKAEALAEAAGMKLGEIERITEGAAYGYSTPARYAKAEEADMGNATRVMASQQEVSASVEIEFELTK